MEILVIGKTGQLARVLAQLAEGTPFQWAFLDRHDCDLSASAADIRASLSEPMHTADIIIIAAAYTAVDQAEEDRETAMAVNARAPGVIATLAAKANIPVIFISSDYVFDGRATLPYSVDASTNPLNIYGESKVEGEARVRSAQPSSVILRTSWVYDATASNFLTTMLRLGETQTSIRVVDDQIGRPTFVGDLALACLRVVETIAQGSGARNDLDNRAIWGTYHVSNSGDPVSWAGFAAAIFEKTASRRKQAVRVIDIPSSDYPTKATRPQRSVLDLSAFEAAFDMVLPNWKDGLNRALSGLPKSRGARGD